MTARDRKRPTDAELAILAVLWEHGPSTVRQVHEVLQAERPIGHTTVLKLMQIMVEKGLLERDEAVRPQVFSPLRSQHQTQRHLVGDLLERAFGGSPGHLVLQALSSRKTTAEEREQIRALLDELEGDSK
jgi:predicted transcriptional regulator